MNDIVPWGEPEESDDFGGKSLFDFLFMKPYEERVVSRFEGLGFLVDTAEVQDSNDPYETAVEHPYYNDGKMIIVETYANKEAAQEGHDKWLEIMTTEPLPAALIDVSTCYSAEMSRLVGNQFVFPKIVPNG